MSDTYRVETDSMGEVSVPAEALYGASTRRALENFQVSGLPMPKRFIHALGKVKRACALANIELGLIDESIGKQIVKVAEEIAQGKHDEQFPIDVFQTGSGTSSNMNANEVISNRCSQLAGETIGSKRPVHPNDHANRGQSSNDVIPSTLHVSVALALKDELLPALSALGTALDGKANDWKEVVKLGRTHLMDATPITLGQEFSGYARQVEKAKGRTERAIVALDELAIGGTAVGTGLNTHESFGSVVCRILDADTGIPFREAKNHFEAQACRDDAVEVAGYLCTTATALTKIANDIRLLGTGPRSGLNELILPPTQPGSSIMPGKTNPVMCEMLVQTAHYSIGMCQTVTRCGQEGHFELNATLPLIAHCLLHSIECLSHATRTFADRCIIGLEANRAQCMHNAENAIGLATALNPHIGYDKAAKVAKHAADKKISIKDACLELGILDEEKLNKILDLKNFV